MITISNEDYAKARRLILTLYKKAATTLRDRELQRQAYQLLKKWDKREKRERRATIASKSEND